MGRNYMTCPTMEMSRIRRLYLTANVIMQSAGTVALKIGTL